MKLRENEIEQTLKMMSMQVQQGVLCLVKHKARNESKDSMCVASAMLHIGTELRCSVKGSSLRIYSRGKTNCFELDKSLFATQRQSAVSVEQKNVSLYRETNSSYPVVQILASSLSRMSYTVHCDLPEIYKQSY